MLILLRRIWLGRAGGGRGGGWGSSRGARGRRSEDVRVVGGLCWIGVLNVVIIDLTLMACLIRRLKTPTVSIKVACGNARDVGKDHISL